MTLRFIRPGKPIENAYVESFNGKFRDECLNEHWFVNLVDAKDAIERWRIDYNTVRPHSSLNGATPSSLPGSLRGLAGCRRLALTRNTTTDNPRSSHYSCSGFWGQVNLSIAVIVLGLSGCGRSTPVAPTPNATRSTAGQLTGIVSNRVTGPIVNARIDVLDGPSAGGTTFTSSDGSFRLSYQFGSSGHLQVSKDGYVSNTVPIPANAQPNGEMAIALHVVTPPVNLAGTYAATFVADPACTQIPETLRTRTYSAEVDQSTQFPDDTWFQAGFFGASFAAGTLLHGTLNSFFGYVEGNTVDIQIQNAYEISEIDEGIAEQVAPGVRLDIFGTATLTIADPQSFSAPLSGYYAVSDATGTQKCASTNHRLMMKRRLDG